mmetsp:Transcript_75430/g.217832  ORF Transcript_75430/g.217832 Transcript_75430/m.217832 type:complete len:90 (+) Transcript_75430:833-1102(+)
MNLRKTISRWYCFAFRLRSCVMAEVILPKKVEKVIKAIKTTTVAKARSFTLTGAKFCVAGVNWVMLQWKEETYPCAFDDDTSWSVIQVL